MKAQQAQQENPLRDAPIGRLIASFAAPSIVSLLVNAAYNMTDQIFIGHTVGLAGNAATNVAFPVTMLLTALAQMIGIGTAANFNLHMGAREEAEAKRFIGAGLTLMSMAGLFLMAVVLLCKTPILLLCGATDTVLPFAEEYLGITAIGIPLLLFTSTASVIIRADGSPSYAMLCTVSGAVLNVALDALFLLVFRMGMQGAALATVIGQAVSFLLCLRYFPRFKTFPIGREMLGLRALRGGCVGRIVTLGMGNFLNHTIMMTVNIVLNRSLAFYGAATVYGSDIPLAVSGAALKLNSVMLAFVVGLAQGCQPILGFNMGAKQYARVKQTYLTAVRLGLCISFLAFLLLQGFPRQIMGLFLAGDELYFSFAERYLRIYLFMVWTFGLQPITVNYFTAIGSVKRGIFLSASRQGFLLLPILLLLPLRFGLDGVLFAAPIADGLAAVLSVAMVALHFRTLTRLQAEQADAAA